MIWSEFSLRKSKDAQTFLVCSSNASLSKLTATSAGYLRVSPFSILIKLDVNFLYASNHIFVRYTFSMSKAVMSWKPGEEK